MNHQTSWWSCKANYSNLTTDATLNSSNLCSPFHRWINSHRARAISSNIDNYYKINTELNGRRDLIRTITNNNKINWKTKISNLCSILVSFFISKTNFGFWYQKAHFSNYILSFTAYLNLWLVDLSTENRIKIESASTRLKIILVLF